MICLTLFWNFLMIGTLSFGGGFRKFLRLPVRGGWQL